MKSKYYLHILHNDYSIYNINFYRFIDNNFRAMEHRFIVLDKCSNNDLAKKNENIMWLPLDNIFNYSKIIRFMKKSEKVIVHGIFMNSVLAELINCFIPGYKLVWMIWGADLYNWDNKTGSLRAKITNHIQRSIRNKLGYLIVSFPADEEEFKKRFSGDIKVLYAHYPVGYSQELILENKCEKESDQLHILIGNSANSALKHEEVLNDLIGFKDKNIKLHLPLNYGSSEYANKIEALAGKLYGDKAICYRESLKLESYIQLLWNMDMAIFKTDRQIGLGNILLLLYMGKKLYFRENSVLYKYFDSKNVDIGVTQDLKTVTFDKLAKNSTCSSQKEVALEYIDENLLVEQWKCVFEGLTD